MTAIVPHPDPSGGPGLLSVPPRRSRRISRADVATDRTVWMATRGMLAVFFAVELGIAVFIEASPLQLVLVAALAIFLAVVIRSEPPASDSPGGHALLIALAAVVVLALLGPGGPAALSAAIFVGPLSAARIDDRRWLMMHTAGNTATLAILGVLAVFELITIVDQPMGLLLMLLAMATPVMVYACMITLEAAEAQGDELERLVRRDALTGVGNRRMMLEVLEHELARHDRQGKSLSIVLLDFDGFKELNDEHGHLTGDDVLRSAAAALQAVVGSRDTVVRAGGDEFCLILPHTGPDEVQRTVNATRAALASVALPSGTLAASTGTASYPQDAATREVLLHVADERMRAQKTRTAPATTPPAAREHGDGPASPLHALRDPAAEPPDRER